MRKDLSLSLSFCGESRMGGGMHIIGGRGRIRMYMYAWGFATRASGGGENFLIFFSQSTYPMLLGIDKKRTGKEEANPFLVPPLHYNDTKGHSPPPSFFFGHCYKTCEGVIERKQRGKKALSLFIHSQLP